MFYELISRLASFEGKMYDICRERGRIAYDKGDETEMEFYREEAISHQERRDKFLKEMERIKNKN